MMEFKKLTTVSEIHESLLEFQSCFPHLSEKVTSLEEFALKLSKYAEVYIAYINNEMKIGGLVCFYANDTVDFCGYITLIGITEHNRKLGMGRKVIDFSVSKMKEKGMKSVKLEVDKDNINARGFYKHIGFNEIGETSNSYYLIKEI